MDRYTQTEYTGYAENIGNSLKGILFGLLLLIASIVLLWWNEGRSVAQADALEEMQEKIMPLPSAAYDAASDGKAVLVQGKIEPISVVTDAQYGVSTDGLVLRRKVQMYQWRETSRSQSQDKLGGGTETVTTYEYSRVWSSVPIDSSRFKKPEGHENPQMNEQGAFFASDAQMGDFHLDRTMVERIGANRPLDLSTVTPRTEAFKSYGGFLYGGKDPAMPQVGDLKISYTYAPAGLYTVAAKQSGRALVPYVTQNGKQLAFFREGRVDAGTIFRQELESNAMLTWALRFVGLILMFSAFSLILDPLRAIAKVIPFMGSLVSGANGIVAGVMTLLLGSLVIALAWLSARPLLSVSIIAIGVATAWGLGKFGAKKGKRLDASVSSETTKR